MPYLPTLEDSRWGIAIMAIEMGSLLHKAQSGYSAENESLDKLSETTIGHGKGSDLLVFIDESGDPGFKVEKGSSPVFVLAMVIFSSPNDALTAQKTIKHLQGRARIKPEWKFAKSSNQARDIFFEGLSDLNFTCRSIVIRKELIYSINLKSNPRGFYQFFARLMCSHDGGILNDARIVIDGSGDREFRKQMQSYMRKELPPGTMKKLTFKDSAKDPLVQLADMCAGAIARSYRDTDRQEADRWRRMLANNQQISDVWDFK